jgi:hypothetical protein
MNQMKIIKVKLLKLIKNEKKNNFRLNNSITKRKVSLDFNTLKNLVQK